MLRPRVNHLVPADACTPCQLSRKESENERERYRPRKCASLPGSDKSQTGTSTTIWSRSYEKVSCTRAMNQEPMGHGSWNWGEREGGGRNRGNEGEGVREEEREGGREGRREGGREGGRGGGREGGRKGS